jgi:two-component system, cell cycle response regulator
MRILVADDCSGTRTLLTRNLTSWGHEPLCVGDGNAAWEVLNSPNSPRLAILDWHMPGLDGTDICTRLRDQIDAPYTFVILLTSRGDRQSLLSGLKAGADDYLSKPFDPEELQQRLCTGKRILELQDRLLAAQEELRNQATHDSLTGVWNRGEIVRFLEREWNRTCRQHSSMGLLLIDVDHFKNVNDLHGHLVGDEVLRNIAKAIRDRVRVYDQVGRFGGEEFLVVLPGTDELTGPHVAERVRAFIERHPMYRREEKINVTVSIGISSVTGGDCLSIEEAIRRADTALYEAKAYGRNQSVVFSHPQRMCSPSMALSMIDT